MATRTRLPRKVAQAISYAAHEDPLDEDEEQSKTERRRRRWGGRGGTRARRRRKVEVEESLEEEEDEQDEQDNEGGDFSKILPVELLNEKVWRKAMGVKELPKLDGEEVNPVKLCAFLFDEACQFCGEKNVVAADGFLLLRLSKPCRVKNLVNMTEVGVGKKCSDLHPAVVLCVVITSLPSNEPRWRRAGQFDDSSGDKKGTSTGLDARAVAKNLKKARGLKRRYWRPDLQKRAAELEEKPDKQSSPGVKEFVLERKAFKGERAELVTWLWTHSDQLTLERKEEIPQTMVKTARTSRLRRVDLEERVLADGVFARALFRQPAWTTDPLVNKGGPVPNSGWNNIKDPLYRLLAQIAAEGIYRRKRKNDEDSEEEYGRYVPPKKPKAVTAAALAWKLIVPALRKVAKADRHADTSQKPSLPVQSDSEESTPAKESKRSKRRNRYGEKNNGGIDERLSGFSWATRETNEFVRARLAELALEQESTDAGNLFPHLAVLKTFPSVKQLYAQPKFGKSDANEEKDLEPREEHKEDVQAEVDEYQQDLRCLVLKLILAATTEMTEDEIDELNPTEALEDYMTILNHAKACGPYGNAYRFPVDLPLEVACAVFMLRGLDTDDPAIKPKDLTDALGEDWLCWENRPKYKCPDRVEWTELISTVHSTAKQYDNTNKVLQAPVIRLRKKSKRHRRWRWHRLRMEFKNRKYEISRKEEKADGA
ncbi:hypothetical protein JCM8547_001282 [Rhodosporidiobolus lusitaniae]